MDWNARITILDSGTFPQAIIATQSVKVRSYDSKRHQSGDNRRAYAITKK